MSDKWGDEDPASPTADADGSNDAPTPPAGQPHAAFRAGADPGPQGHAAGPVGTPLGALTVSTIGRAWRALVEAVGDLLERRSCLWVLEAGAGTRTLFDLPEDAYVVGVDRDEQALGRNARLDQRVAVELADYRPLAAGFDLVTCWYVLDGLADPAPVLDRFAGWTAEGGLVVLGVPNLRSPLGLLARLTGRARLRGALTPAALCRRFADRGYTPVFQVFFEDAAQIALRRRLRLGRTRWRAAQAVVRLLTGGLLDAARTDYIVVFRRDAAGQGTLGRDADGPTARADRRPGTRR